MRQMKVVDTGSVETTTLQVWSGTKLVSEYDVGDETRYDYLYGPSGMPLELMVTRSDDTTASYAYQCDAGGSVIGMTDEAGAEVARYAYDPYGNQLTPDGTHPIAARNPLRYRGYYLDSETQLYYLPARYYDPQSARFISIDPAPPSAGSPESLNRYSYCMADPVQGTDPTGAIMTEYYYASERAAVGEENLSKGRFHHRGTGSLRYRSLAEYYRTIRAGRARDIARQAAINAARSAMGRLRDFELRNDIARAGADEAGAATAGRVAEEASELHTHGAWLNTFSAVAGTAATVAVLVPGVGWGVAGVLAGASVIAGVASAVVTERQYQKGYINDDQRVVAHTLTGFSAATSLGTWGVAGAALPGAAAVSVLGTNAGIAAAGMSWW